MTHATVRRILPRFGKIRANCYCKKELCENIEWTDLAKKAIHQMVLEDQCDEKFDAFKYTVTWLWTRPVATSRFVVEPSSYLLGVLWSNANV